MIEVTGFTFLALFISRLGAAPVAGHQIAANLVALMFMMPLAIANASGTLVAQRIGAGDAADARHLSWHGLLIGVGCASLLGAAVYLSRAVIVGLYTHDAVIAAAAFPLLAWVVLFHVADAAQTVAAFVLRAYRIATVPLVIYAVAIWGVGLGGGYALAFDASGAVPPALRGAPGFWAAATVGLMLAGAGMSAFLAKSMKPRSTSVRDAASPARGRRRRGLARRDQLAFDRRREDAHPGALLGSAGDDRVEDAAQCVASSSAAADLRTRRSILLRALPPVRCNARPVPAVRSLL